MGGDAPGAYVEVTGRVAWVAIPRVIWESGGTPVPVSSAGGPVVVVPETEDAVVEPVTEASAGVPDVVDVTIEDVDDDDDDDEGEATNCRLCAI
jgi:hypothetical protein